jgi:CRISPR-associated protein Cas1
MKDLHLLPKLRDSLSFLYVEHQRIDQEALSIAFHDAEGKTSVPCASLNTLLLGPGTSISHAAIKALADNGCLVLWVGEGSVRFYAEGMGETRSSQSLLHQAKLCSDPGLRLQVVRKLYEMRFPDPLPANLTLQQIRGKEGIRVREAYAKASRQSKITWAGRSYKTDSWEDADPINRALSAANSCLYGICHSAIISTGYSPALGFIHTGKMLSFVYDIADLYKADVTIPIAFQAVSEGLDNLERRVRHKCRDYFYSQKLLQRILPDIDKALLISRQENSIFDLPNQPPSNLWDSSPGGINWADEPDTPEDELS